MGELSTSEPDPNTMQAMLDERRIQKAIRRGRVQVIDQGEDYRILSVPEDHVAPATAALPGAESARSARHVSSFVGRWGKRAQDSSEDIKPEFEDDEHQNERPSKQRMRGVAWAVGVAALYFPAANILGGTFDEHDSIQDYAHNVQATGSLVIKVGNGFLKGTIGFKDLIS